MTKKQLEKVDKLFVELAGMAPCKTCTEETCEECRWTTFAAEKYMRRWDHYNYMTGGHSLALAKKKKS